MKRNLLLNRNVIVVLIPLLPFSLFGKNGCIKVKIHPVLREQIVKQKNQRNNHISNSEEETPSIDVFVETENPPVLENMGLHIRSIIGNVVTTSVPVDQIQRVAGMDGVRCIEPAIPCSPQLDVSMPEIGIQAVWNGSLGETYNGENVIIGVYDSGIDWKHADFIHPNGTSRILWLWDQTDGSGKEPDSFQYGSEYSQSDINDEIDGTPVGMVQGIDSLGHGTHVAGIAAGNGRASQSQAVYQGAAPEADLIVVKGGNENFNSTCIIDGLNYIFEKANAQYPSRPVVINLSAGGIHTGPHDGSSLFEQSLDNLLNEPGRAIVVAAGNDGNRDIHFKGDMADVGTGSDFSVGFHVGYNEQDKTDYVFFDIWYVTSADLSVSIQMPSGLSIGPVKRGELLRWPSSDAALVNIDNASDGTYLNGDCEIYIQISDVNSGGNDQSFDTGEWQLLFNGNPGRFDGWLYESSVNAILTTHVDRTTILREPANARRCIAVGSYISRLDWPSAGNTVKIVTSVGELSGFSSSGPPRPNSNGSSPMQKPEITAPGEYILSTYSSATVLDVPDESYLTVDRAYRAMKGTSMAAPHVTGVVALMFQRDPEMNVSDIRRWIIETARKDVFTGMDVWDEKWGYGKLNASGAVYQTDVAVPNNYLSEAMLLEQNYPNPFNDETIIQYTVPMNTEQSILSIYDIRGRVVRRFKPQQTGGRQSVLWDGRDSNGETVVSGLYIVQLKSASQVLSRKMLYMK